MDTQRAVSRPLTRRYIAALSIIALLSIGAHVALRTALSTQTGAAAEINVSGRQRMLSQRIALHVALLASARPAQRADIRTTLDGLIDRMEQSHDGLINGDRQQGLPGDPSPALDRLYFGAPGLDELVGRYLDAARQTLTLPAAALSPRAPDVLAVQRMARGAQPGDLLPTLDAAVGAYQAETEAEFTAVERIAVAVLAITLLTLVLEGRFVFRPLIQRIAERTRAVVAARARLRAVIDNALVGVLTVQPDGMIVDANRTATRLFGAERSDATTRLVGVDIADLVEAPVERGMVIDLVRHAVTGHEVTQEVTLLGTDQFIARLSARAAATPDATLVTVVVTDITEQRRAEQQLQHMALHDPLTGLGNRALFHDRVDHALNRAERDGHTAAVLFIDLDEFKTVNDSLGHHVGDRMLIAMSQRITECLRQSDTAARLGGDEFAVLVEDLPALDIVRAIADRVLEALALPVELDDHVLAIAASIGVAISGDGASATDLLRDADTAMYDAKRAGKNRIRYFTAAMHDTALQRLGLRGDLDRAIERDELDVHYQPIIDLASQELVGLEALLRWTHADRGVVPPAEFIPVAEDSGMIGDIGRWVLRRGVADAARWVREHGDAAPGYLSINVSAVQLRSADFVDDVRGALVDTIPPTMLVLEVTETALMRDRDTASAALAELRAMGIRIALDDFGTGYSSLSYLQQFPVDLVKIDGSFIARLDSTPVGSALTRGMLDMARSLGLDTIAEGVETATQAGTLAGLHCQLAQGYHFARPLDAAQLSRYLRERTRVAQS